MSAIRIVGFYALAACIFMIGVDAVIAFILEGKSLTSSTISDIAAGKHSWIQDAAISALAIALGAIGIVLIQIKTVDLRGSIGAALLACVAAAMIALSVYNEYGDGDLGGLTIHMELVVFIGFGFSLALILLADTLGRLRNWMRWGCYGVAGLWLATGLTFFGTPTSFDGLVERAAALCMIAWIAAAGILFIYSGDTLKNENA